MAQINFHTTAQFDDDTAVVMRVLGIATKSQAIRFVMGHVADTCRDALRDRAKRANAPSR